ncbi:hypothetical protein ACRARG_01630 [Pseudooceanicola sp. C21-150M6]|uniref:hypothetical protein n=1 Tax=Pseudooceanicola sp. C21-150M6 TaxID=3434355 RepID=UPI003D7FAE5C
MIRSSALLLLLTAPASAEGLELTDRERVAFGQEVRAAVLSAPEVVEQALNPPPATEFEAARDADLDRLEAAEALFQPSARGIGAAEPRLTIVFFESFPCAGCGAAWADLEALVAAYPDIRVEPRFAEDSGAAQVLLSLLAHQGGEAYAAAHRTLLAAETPEALEAALREGGWPSDRMLRPEPGQEAAMFRTLELDTAPSYVLPGLMLRGAMPRVVLEKYLK